MDSAKRNEGLGRGRRLSGANKKDADISSQLSAEEIARVFDLKHYLRNVDKVFDRVFG